MSEAFMDYFDEGKVVCSGGTVYSIDYKKLYPKNISGGYRIYNEKTEKNSDCYRCGTVWVLWKAGTVSSVSGYTVLLLSPACCNQSGQGGTDGKPDHIFWEWGLDMAGKGQLYKSKAAVHGISEKTPLKIKKSTIKNLH